MVVAGVHDVDLGSVWVADAAELPGFHVTRRTTGPRKPSIHGFHGLAGTSRTGKGRFLNRVSQVRSLPGPPKNTLLGVGGALLLPVDYVAS